VVVVPSQILRLGPFTGGLNKAADPVVIGDEELIECLNLELDIDGSLTARPAIQVVEEGSADVRFLIFGSVTFSGVIYLFATRNGGTYVSPDLGVNWTQAFGGSPRECKSMAVYGDTVWLPATPGSANGGISWTPAGGFVGQPTIPRGEACVVHKNRLYICPGDTATSNASRLSFSQAADFTIWPVSNFIDVQQGDGDTLNNIITYQNNLLLFKSESTYVLAYDLDPVDAVLQPVNPVIGSPGSFGVAQYENAVYCMYYNKVYEIINFNFSLINLKVPFEFDDSLPTGTTARYEDQHISIFGDRLIARYYNKTYSFNLRTRTWSEWRKTDDSSTIEWHIFGPLIRANEQEGTGVDDFYTSYSFDVSSGGYKIIKIHDGKTVADLEGLGSHTMQCIATTKDYDFADPVRYKRIFWWGADILSGNEIIADIEPITLTFAPTWDDIGDLAFEDLNTWGSPLEEIQATQTTVAADGIFNTNKLVKFLKSLRFRKANFSVQIETDGSSTEPAKIFSYIVVVSTKQLVSTQVS